MSIHDWRVERQNLHDNRVPLEKVCRIVAIKLDPPRRRILCPRVPTSLSLKLIEQMVHTRDRYSHYRYTDDQVDPAVWQEALLILQMEDAL